MQAKQKALLAAGLLAGAAAMTGCTAMQPSPTPTPRAAQQQTAQPATAKPDASAQPEDGEPAGEETPASLAIEANGEEIEAQAIREQGRLLLPLMETAEALGWKAEHSETEGDGQTRRTITLDKDDSRITVTWTVSDNTTRGVTWQKDGLLIPVDTFLTTMNEIVYVPAAFFEEGMDVRVAQRETQVILSTPEPVQTPQTEEESSGEAG